ncbi:MAG: hypothetical protein Q8S20_01680 [Sulfuritalea sp.]|nr:hypothetical protein [Sulfuritalea sp.]
MSATTLTPATTAKATAITAAIRPAMEEAAPGVYAHRVALLLARLTSANKDEREQAKNEVRQLVKVGSEILAAEQAAQDLANFANRNEP